MYIQNLVLEVTRKCNLRCDHCLRGDAQAIDLDLKVIDKLFKTVDSIDTITFSGGEPTLNISAIKYFVKQAIKRNISIGSFYIVTNGKEQSLPLIQTLIELYSICDDPDSCALSVSRDQYHEGCETPLYNALRFYNDEDRRSEISDQSLISEGRAMEYGLGYGRSVKHDGFDVDEDRVDSMVYISSNGNVTDGCDFSFERIDEESIGNILTENLTDIIKKGVLV